MNQLYLEYLWVHFCWEMITLTHSVFCGASSFRLSLLLKQSKAYARREQEAILKPCCECLPYPILRCTAASVRAGHIHPKAVLQISSTYSLASPPDLKDRALGVLRKEPGTRNVVVKIFPLSSPVLSSGCCWLSRKTRLSGMNGP